MKTFEGRLVAEGLKVGIIVARFNEFIGSKLLSGAIDGLVRHGMNEEDIEGAWVPGAFEIPVAAQRMAQSKKYDAIICLLQPIMMMCGRKCPKVVLLYPFSLVCR